MMMDVFFKPSNSESDNSLNFINKIEYDRVVFIIRGLVIIMKPNLGCLN